jgi:2-phosphosulfolactate phosphatase
MPNEIHIHLLPSLVTESELAGKSVVVIDVLRATTTIVHALAAGADEVLACLEIDEALALAANLGREQVVLGGERGGLPIDGFDLGNSPTEYRRETVGGRTVVFTTTNGTRAMKYCHEASEVLLGAFCNLSAVCAVLRNVEAVHLLCAGTKGLVTREDVLLAGAIADRLADGADELNDEAAIAIELWRSVVSQLKSVSLSAQLRDTAGGRNLARTNQVGDIDTAAEIDRFDLVPQLDVEQWSIRAR